jgi:hypothetical protein
MPEPGGGIAEIETRSKALAGGVVPDSLDIKVDPGGPGEIADSVAHPVGVPRAGVRGVVGEQEGSGSQGHADGGQRRRGLVQGLLDEGACDRVDGEVPLLVRLGIGTSSRSEGRRHAPPANCLRGQS